MMFSPWVLEEGWDLCMQRGAVRGLGPNSPPRCAIQHASLTLNCFLVVPSISRPVVRVCESYTLKMNIYTSAEET